MLGSSRRGHPNQSFRNGYIQVLSAPGPILRRFDSARYLYMFAARQAPRRPRNQSLPQRQPWVLKPSWRIGGMAICVARAQQGQWPALALRGNSVFWSVGAFRKRALQASPLRHLPASRFVMAISAPWDAMRENPRDASGRMAEGHPIWPRKGRRPHRRRGIFGGRRTIGRFSSYLGGQPDANLPKMIEMFADSTN